MLRPLAAVALSLALATPATAAVTVVRPARSDGDRTLRLRFDVPRVGTSVDRALLRVRAVRGTQAPIAVRAGGRRVAMIRGARDGRVLVFDVTRAIHAAGGLHRLVVSSRGRIVLARPRLRIAYAGPANVELPARAAPAPAAGAAPSLPPAPAAATERLAGVLGDVSAALVRRYAVRDDGGLPLDGLQILQTGAAEYVGVYHALTDGAFASYVATSRDLVRWRRAAQLDVHASQPAIAALPGGGFVVAHEHDAPDGNRLRFRRYPTLAALLAAAPDREFTAPRTLSATAEGTPSIRVAGAGGERLEVGFHRLTAAGVDRQASGVLEGFRRWTARPLVDVDAAFEALGTAGNLGDRSHLTLADGAQVDVFEAQSARGDWASWRLVLRDPATGALAPVAPRTDGGSRAFANPALARVELPGGAQAVVLSAFVPAEGAGPGEAGTLVAVHPW